MKPTWPRYRRTVHIVLTGVGMAGIVALFLPFDSAPSLASMLRHFGPVSLLVIGLFFLSIPIGFWSTRWALSGSFTLPERFAAYVLGIASVCLTATFEVRDYLKYEHWTFDFIFVFPLVITLGIFGLIWNSRSESARCYNPLMALQVCYLSLSVPALVEIWGDNWYHAEFSMLIASLAYLTQILLVTFQPRVGKEVEVVDSVGVRSC